MAITTPKIMRTSIFILLKNFHLFTSSPSLVALPFALATLLAPSLVPSSHLFPLVHLRVSSLTLTLGLPKSSELSFILNYKLSQTILSSLLVSPFALSFLLLSKTLSIRALQCKKPLKSISPFSWVVIFRPLLITHLCNSLLLLSMNATCFFFLVVSFDCSVFLGFSSHEARVFLVSILGIAYVIVLANAHIICSLSLLLSGLERRGGFNSILKASVVTRRRTATALSLSMVINMVLAAVEALFQYRVVRGYRRGMGPNYPWMVLEAMLVAYLYGVLIVLDTIAGCVFLKRCRQEHNREDDSYWQATEIHERNEMYLEMKGLESRV